MKYGICLNPVIPVRFDADEKAEMVTQLLFGEVCELHEEKDSFVKITNSKDRYRGWADRKMLKEIDEDVFNKYTKSPVYITNIPITDVFCLEDKTIMHLSAGSRLPFYDDSSGTFGISESMFQIHSSFVAHLSESSKEDIVSSAMMFLNTPYLWGGKNIFGIDCSGLVQVAFSMRGFDLPRDASMQVKEGAEINSISEAEPLDLFFFKKNEKITHVGIYLGDGRIIHSSCKVKIETVDEKGIINSETRRYSHDLATIRRI